MFVDADFAARETMLRSTSGVAEFYGKSPIEFGSSTQSVRALSTGESEFYAITKGSAHSLHSQAILKGFGVVVEAVVLSNASAGIGIASRQGCGRLKRNPIVVHQIIDVEKIFVPTFYHSSYQVSLIDRDFGR